MLLALYCIRAPHYSFSFVNRFCAALAAADPPSSVMNSRWCAPAASLSGVLPADVR